ncbi:Hypothetical protein GLP15_395 [Giardia lamblia P15]|uniref:Uncharacterized protein n=1 Tax=Giardia intestinalis (strain P15) TaxID=658858 RepID=E1EXT2_GIAIA|nr:Hypothetical protein GLP15_395 [Giardia lamblia P15]
MGVSSHLTLLISLLIGALSQAYNATIAMAIEDKNDLCVILFDGDRVTPKQWDEMLRIGDEVDRLYLVDRQVHGNEDIFMGEEHFEPIFFIFFREEGRAERMPYPFSYFNALNFYYSNFNMGYSSMVHNITSVDRVPEIYARMQKKMLPTVRAARRKLAAGVSVPPTDPTFHPPVLLLLDSSDPQVESHTAEIWYFYKQAATTNSNRATYLVYDCYDPSLESRLQPWCKQMDIKSYPSLFMFYQNIWYPYVGAFTGTYLEAWMTEICTTMFEDSDD